MRMSCRKPDPFAEPAQARTQLLRLLTAVYGNIRSRTAATHSGLHGKQGWSMASKACVVPHDPYAALLGAAPWSGWPAYQLSMM